MPDNQAPTREGAPQYRIQLGGLEIDLLDALDPEDKAHLLEPGETPEKEPEEKPEPAKATAQPEGEQKTESTEKGKEEPEKKAAPPEPEAKKETPKEKPSEPEKFNFKIKYRGEGKELSLTKDELIARLQMAEDYQIKTSELARERGEIEPYKPILKSPAFQEWLKEQVESGTFVPPKAAPEPARDAMYEYYRRKADPDFDVVQAELRAYSLALPPEAQAILDQDPNVFNREYDRIAQIVRGRKQTANPDPAPDAKPKVDPEITEKILKSKEVLKDKGIVEKPGTAPDETDDVKWKRREKDLVKALRESGGHDMDLAAELLLHRGFAGKR